MKYVTWLGVLPVVHAKHGSQQENDRGHEQEPCHLPHFDVHGALWLCPDDGRHSAEHAVPMEVYR